MNTEFYLLNWRKGSTYAERLMSSALAIEGYEHIDPQSPIGGPDGTKDIVCTKLGLKYIAGCYFPSSEVRFSEISSKFNSDLQGAIKNDAKGFIFFTNQKLTIAERENLVKIAKKTSINISDIFHLERIRSILDSPKGYGLRLEYLDIAMKPEEQLSYISEYNRLYQNAIKENNININANLEEIKKDIKKILNKHQKDDFIEASNSRLENDRPKQEIDFVTSSLTPLLIKWLHKLLTELSDLPNTGKGEFRCVQVYFGNKPVVENNTEFLPADYDMIPKLMDDLLGDWNLNYKDIQKMDEEEILHAIAKFHYNFMKIHPFLDYNGRMARLITKQQVYELLGKNIDVNFNNEYDTYFRTLISANSDNYNGLKMLLKSSII